MINNNFYFQVKRQAVEQLIKWVNDVNFRLRILYTNVY
jgi:hypothetical protein